MEDSGSTDTSLAGRRSPLLLLGSEGPAPDFLLQWLATSNDYPSVRSGLLDAFLPIPSGHMAVIIAPHHNPQLRDKVQDVTHHCPVLMLGYPEERPFYPEAAAWIDLNQVSPQRLHDALQEISACASGQRRPILSRHQWMPKFRHRLEQETDLYLQLVSIRWRPGAAGDSASIRFATQEQCERQLQGCAPDDALIGKLLDDQFILLSRDPDAMARRWLPSFEDNPSFLWTSFTSRPAALHSYDELGATLHTAVREIERTRILRSSIAGRSLKDSETAMFQTLANGLRSRQFYLDFQPQFDTHTGCMVGAEALTRWLHPTLGVVPPTTFIRDAEMAGLIRSLGSWALTETLNAWHRIHSQGLTLRMAVNVSFPEVADPDYADKVFAALDRARVPPQCLELELTETAMMLDESVSYYNLQRLKQAGIHIVLDDFGTGFSSLSHLKDLPITGIKLDRAFVSPLGSAQDDSSLHIVSSMLELAQRLGLETTAEGVEDQHSLEIIHALGCDRVQGFFYAEPMSLDALLHRANAQNTIMMDVNSGQHHLF